MLVLAYPWLLLLAILPLLLIWILPSATQLSLYVPSVYDYQKDKPYQKNAWLQHLPHILYKNLLLIIIWLLLVFASARPQILGETVEFPLTGRSLMLAIDVSGSMKLNDLDKNNPSLTRLDVLKQVANQFLLDRQGDRIGLIIFGTNAYLQTPLTFDYETIITQLQDAEIGIAGEATAIGDSIGLAIKRLSTLDSNDNNINPKTDIKIDQTVLILLTDGANTAGSITPSKAADLAKIANLKIYTIGIGAHELIQKTIFGTRRINPSADLDEKTLRYIANTTGGKYFRATNRQSLQEIYQLLNQLEPVATDVEKFQPVRDIFYIPLLFALLLSFVQTLAKLLPNNTILGLGTRLLSSLKKYYKQK